MTATNGLVDELIDQLSVKTVFTIPIFGGIKIAESVVVMWIIMAIVIVASIFLKRKLSVENPESIIIDQETTEDLRKRISDYLSPMENKVLDLYLKGKGYVEIGGILNKSPKSVDNALQRIRSKIREVIS